MILYMILYIRQDDEHRWLPMQFEKT